jgi:hypothetical protein
MDVAGRDLEIGRAIATSDLDWRTYTQSSPPKWRVSYYEGYDVIGKTFNMERAHCSRLSSADGERLQHGFADS